MIDENSRIQRASQQLTGDHVNYLDWSHWTISEVRTIGVFHVNLENDVVTETPCSCITFVIDSKPQFTNVSPRDFQCRQFEQNNLCPCDQMAVWTQPEFWAKIVKACFIKTKTSCKWIYLTSPVPKLSLLKVYMHLLSSYTKQVRSRSGKMFVLLTTMRQNSSRHSSLEKTYFAMYVMVYGDSQRNWNNTINLNGEKYNMFYSIPLGIEPEYLVSTHFVSFRLGLSHSTWYLCTTNTLAGRPIDKSKKLVSNLITRPIVPRCFGRGMTEFWNKSTLGIKYTVLHCCN